MKDNDSANPRGSASLAARSSRRRVLGGAVLATSAALLPLGRQRARAQEAAPRVFDEQRQATLEAFVDRLIPADELGPGALAAGAADYINRSLADWNRDELPTLRAGLEALDAAARAREGEPFARLAAARQDALLGALERDELTEIDKGAALFTRLRRLTLEGMFGDPYWGGNRDFAGWDLIGYPGAVMASTPAMQRMRERLPPLHTSAWGEEFDGD